MREEYPRPDFERSEWLCLNGKWDFFDGESPKTIEVPFVCQSRLSGIGEALKSDYVVYERVFKVPEKWKGRRVFLHFGAVDYECKVFINHQMAGQHVGGQTSFSFDITDWLTWQEEKIRVEVCDWLCDETIPRGKQFWKEEPEFIWYTPSTGIWQSVWLEVVDDMHLEEIYFKPDIDEGTVKVDYRFSRATKFPCTMQLKIKNKDKEVFEGQWQCHSINETISVDVFRKKALDGSFHFTGAYWSPENPNLYDVEVNLVYNGNIVDTVKSYFGMRKIELKNGKLYLNHKPCYQKLVLDQGYWDESLITAPSDEAYKEDILKAKAMGFNGCRKHEKVEDPRFLYWADKLGFLVWEGMASFWSYTRCGVQNFISEWMDVLKRDYNHPSIIVWGMLNESWGVPGIGSDSLQESFAKSLYHMAHSFDDTRPVISNDGWENTTTDICAFHSYQHGSKTDEKQQQFFKAALKDVDKMGEIVEKPLFAVENQYKGQPVMLTEFGGISMTEASDGWGYTTVGKEGFLEELNRIVDAVYDSELISGFCYTQLSDVQQEINGLLTVAHEFKFPPEKIKAILDKKQ